MKARKRVKPAAVSTPLVAVIMGSKNDWPTMSRASEMLSEFGVAHECEVVSAHRTPQWLTQFATQAESRGIEVIIAGAGGAAHLPGMTAAHTAVPVLGVPVESRALQGLDSLLSIAQMPAGIPVGTLAIGPAGAANAGLLAVAILSNSRPALRQKLNQFRAAQTEQVLMQKLEPVVASITSSTVRGAAKKSTLRGSRKPRAKSHAKSHAKSKKK